MDFAEVMVENRSSVFEVLAMDGNETVLPGHKTFAAASRTDKEVNQPKPGASPPETAASAGKPLRHAMGGVQRSVSISEDRPTRTR